MNVSKYDTELDCLNCSLPFCDRRSWSCLLNPREKAPEGKRAQDNKRHYAKYLETNDRKQYWKDYYERRKNAQNVQISTP